MRHYIKYAGRDPELTGRYWGNREWRQFTDADSFPTQREAVKVAFSQIPNQDSITFVQIPPPVPDVSGMDL